MGPDTGLVIAIDGPAASGKSTVAIALARRHGLALVDSGSMYRAVTLLAVERGVADDDEPALTGLAREVASSFRLELPEDSPPRVYLGERDVTPEIRSPQVGNAVSPVSALPGVREMMVGLQRSVVEGRGAVVEGRDIGTTVFPDAPLKIFLDASSEERARRRFDELADKGVPATEAAVEKEIATRDSIDSSRRFSPLTPAPDAFRIDTTELTVGQVVDLVVQALEALGP